MDTKWRGDRSELLHVAEWADSRRVTRHLPNTAREPQVEMPLDLRHARKKLSPVPGLPES